MKKCKGSTQWVLVTLGPTLIPTTVLSHQTFTSKPSLPKTIIFYPTPVPVKQTLTTIHRLKCAFSDDDAYKPV